MQLVENVRRPVHYRLAYAPSQVTNFRPIKGEGLSRLSKHHTASPVPQKITSV